MNKNALCMLIFNDVSYIVGGCIAAFTHRKFIDKYNLKLDIIVMVDQNIYKYKDELLKYFDKVVLIEIFELKLHEKYRMHEKYSKWMKFLISKWQALNQDEYDKILFVDIDLLPISEDFYNVFKLNTPAILVEGQDNFGQIVKQTDIINNIKTIKDEEYYNIALKMKASLNATLVLLKPDKKLYQEYMNFIKICESNNGYISNYMFGPDETTLTLFLLFYKNIQTYYIPHEYALIPWNHIKTIKKYKLKAINFASIIKPWLKVPMIQFYDEVIWHKIAKYAFTKSSIVYEIYINKLIEQLYKFVNTYKENLVKKNSPYNMECLTNDKLKLKTMKLIDYIDKKKSLDSKQIKKVLKYTTKIYKKIKKELVVDNTNILKVINQ
jgi:hypothetical protein